MDADEPADTPLILGVSLRAPTNEPPDISGPYAECPTCGASVGPLAANVRCSIVMTCPCGNRLEAWPSE